MFSLNTENTFTVFYSHLGPVRTFIYIIQVASLFTLFARLTKLDRIRERSDPLDTALVSTLLVYLNLLNYIAYLI